MINRKKTLGIIGGMGPMATSYFLELLVRLSNVKLEQDHLDSIVYNMPSIPDRTKYIEGKSTENPIDKIKSIIESLNKQGVDYIAMPCLTAHSFLKKLNDTSNVKIINVVDEISKYLDKNNVKSVGIMATTGTIESNIFQTYLKRNGIACFLPEKEYQNKLMELIYTDIKYSNEINIDKFKDIAKHLQTKGIERIILGCTELSLINRNYKLDKTYVDAMEVLAVRALAIGGIPIKEQYKELYGD